MIACPEGMQQEKRFLDALEQADQYRIRGSHLDLLDARGATIARFEAVALK
jgi:heat shock protein HslJ